MIDHTGVAATNYEKSKQFYTQALAPLGYQLMMELPKEVTGGRGVAGFGVPPKPDFWLARERDGEQPAGAHRIPRGLARARGCVLQGGDRSRRPRQRPARPAPALSREVLRRVRARSGRAQHRSVSATRRSGFSPTLSDSVRSSASGSFFTSQRVSKIIVGSVCADTAGQRGSPE